MSVGVTGVTGLTGVSGITGLTGEFLIVCIFPSLRVFCQNAAHSSLDLA